MAKRQYHYVNSRLPGPEKPAFSFWRKKKSGPVPGMKPPKVDMAKVQAALAKLAR